MPKGKLIVIEGTDCSGKKTQREMLVDRLNADGFKSVGYGFPCYNTTTGNIVGVCYLGKDPRDESTGLSNPNFDITELSNFGSWFGDPDKVDPEVASLLYAADRRAARPEMLDLLKNGINIISDRYVESNMGHQCGKLESVNGRTTLRDWIEKLEYELLELPRPDLVIFLYMPFNAAKRLKKNRKESAVDGHETNDKHLQNAERAYLELAKHYGWRKIDCSSDGENARKKIEIHEEVYGIVREFLVKS